MIWVKVIFGAIALTVASSLAAVLIRFNRKRLHIIRAAAAATREQLEQIYRLIEARWADHSQGFVLARTNESAGDGSCIIAVPGEMKEFPWAGMSITVDIGDDIQFRFFDDPNRKTQLLGWKYRPVAVPRLQLKSGKARNQFAPAQYLKGNEELRDRLRGVCAEYPAELLSYLLCAGQESFEFEPISQGRIGTSAAWVQDPEFQYCDQCKKRMALILQLPGTLFHGKAFQNGTFYFFGCKKHTDQTRTVYQFT